MIRQRKLNDEERRDLKQALIGEDIFDCFDIETVLCVASFSKAGTPE